MQVCSWHSGCMPDPPSSDAVPPADVVMGQSQRGLHELLHAVSEQDHEGADLRDRVDRLLEVVLATSPELDLEQTLHQLVQSATEVVSADYAALDVWGREGRDGVGWEHFVTAGVDEQTRHAIGSRPTGRGVLGLIQDGTPLRLTDVTAHPASAGFPAGHPSMRTFLGVSLQGHTEVSGRLYLAEKTSGEPFTEDDQILLQALASAAGTAIDNAALYAKAQRRQRWFEAVGEVTTELLASNDPDQVLHLIAQHAVGLTDADYAVIALPDEPELSPTRAGQLTVRACAGTDPDALTGRAIPLSQSTSGAVFTDGAPRNVDRLAYDFTEHTPVTFGPALVLPLRTQSGDVSGVLLATRAAGAAVFGDDQMQLLTSFADQAALALQQARDQRARRELALLAERDRIARDLHDQVIQRLFAVGLAMQGTQRLARSATLGARLTEHIDQLQEIITEIRSAIFDLQHSTGDADPRVRSRLRGTVDEVTAETGIHTTVRMSGPLETLPSTIAEHAEAVVREALSNVVQHADASELTLTVSADTELRIVVTDNGRGIPDGVAHSGLGNLTRRATDTGGRCTITANIGGGTRLTWSVPWSKI